MFAAKELGQGNGGKGMGVCHTPTTLRPRGDVPVFEALAVAVHGKTLRSRPLKAIFMREAGDGQKKSAGSVG